MAKYVVLHGHFFLPPLEDVWTGQVYNFKPQEESLNLYRRALKACYGANSASRILNPDGRIHKISNNYNFLSFSFDPGLLGWIQTNAPNVYNRILDGDREALARTGHGNALATTWTSAVLPLAAPWEQEVLIDWGLKAFEAHFGRASEGFWLPHQAVSSRVLDLLVDRGLRFVVLPSTAAEATMPLGDGNWVPLGAGTVPSNRPLRIDRPNGSLTAFFSHPGLMKALTEDHVLRDADALLNLVRSQLEREKAESMITAAVPGEFFGDIEPFADMCLSAFREKVEAVPDFALANYAQICDFHPPKELVKLKKGEDELGVSGTCAHGLARWFRGCGCGIPGPAGWHQHWRGPLREALVTLREDTDAIFQVEVPRFSASPADQIRREYIQVVLGIVNPQDFLKAHGKPGLLPENGSHLLHLLEGVNLTLKMFASTGWDYADLSFREASQVLFYALRLSQMYQEFAAQDLFFGLREGLARAQTNDPGQANGQAILEKTVVSQQKGWEFPAALFILDTFLRSSPSYSHSIGPFRLESMTRKKVKHSDQFIEISGQIHLLNTAFLEKRGFDYLLIEDLNEGVSLYLKDLAQDLPPQAFDLHTLPMSEKEEIVQLMTLDIENFLVESTQSILPKLKKAFVYSRLLGINQTNTVRALMEIAINRRIANLEPAQDLQLSEVQLLELDQSLHFGQEYGLNLDKEKLNRRVSYLVSLVIGERNEFTEEQVVRYLDRLLNIA